MQDEADPDRLAAHAHLLRQYAGDIGVVGHGYG